MIDTGVNAESAGGYARALTTEEKNKQHDVLAERMSQAHAVICAAAIPGRKAPVIITQDMVEGMMPDTVIVDMAAETGGNCELTHVGETYMHGDVFIVGVTNLPSSGSVHASEMYARNLFSMLRLMLDDGKLHLDWQDEILAGCLLTHQAEVYDAHTAELMGLPVAPPIGSKANNTAEEQEDKQAVGWIAEEEPADDTLNNTQNDDARSATVQASNVAGVASAATTVVLYAYGVKRYSQLASLDADGIHRLEIQLELDNHEALVDWVAEAAQLERQQ